MLVTFLNDSEEARTLLKADPSLAPLFAKTEKVEFSTLDDHFLAFVQAIVGQQLSGKVAQSIYRRLEALFAGVVTPAKILGAERETLRQTGLSERKAEYLRSLAGLTEAGTIDFANMPAMSDHEILATMTKVKGIGRWSVEMFLLFSLGRRDVFPAGDLGIRYALRDLYGRDFSEKEALALSEKWRPHRSLVTHYLWHYREN